MIRIELAQEEIRNGERIRGQAQWNSEGKEPRKIEVVCRWRIEGKKAGKREEIIDLEIELSPQTQVTIPFEFDIPREGPLSYDGKLFRIIWEIVARVDLPFARDEVETKTFVVRPRRYDPDEELLDEDDEDLEEEEGEEEEGEA